MSFFSESYLDMRVIFKTQKMSSLDHKNKHTHTHNTNEWNKTHKHNQVQKLNNTHSYRQTKQ